MLPIIKCRGHYVMAFASVSVNIWFLSIIGQMPGLIDPIFLWLFGVTRGRFLSMISSTAHPRWPLRPPSRICFPESTAGYTFTPCVGSFACPGIDTRVEKGSPQQDTHLPPVRDLLLALA
jgi:hypothetical protein